MSNFNPNKPGTARLATDRYDFQAHIDGQEFRHSADELDMNPVIVPGATTIQNTLANFNTIIELLETSGQGFVTVGDGYDTWHDANGVINFDATIPSLDTLLNPIFTALYDGYTLSADFSRIQRGGIVVIKAGTYIVRKTINIPPGIVLMGEGYGTKIINATNLTSAVPPVQQAFVISAATNTTPIQITTSVAIPNLATGDIVNISGCVGNTAANTNTLSVGQWIVNVINPTTFELKYGFYDIGLAGSQSSTGNGAYAINSGTARPIKPVFQILPPDLLSPRTGPNGDDSAIDTNVFAFERETKIFNMVIADNFVMAPVQSDANYKQAQNYTSSVQPFPPGLIQQLNGSSLVLDKVTFVGRAISDLTGSAIYLENNITNPTPSGTLLKINNCTMDGFSIPVVWLNAAGGNDYLEITNNKIRAYGNYAGSGSTGSNCMFAINDSTSLITNNTLYGNGTNITCAAYVNDVIATIPAKQARGKLTVATNDIVISKPTSTTLSFSPIKTNVSVNSTYLSYLSYGNNFQDTFDVSVDGYAALSANAGGVVTMPNAIITNAIIVSENVATSSITNATINTLTVNGAASVAGTTTLNGTFVANSTSTFNSNLTTSPGSATSFNGAVFYNCSIVTQGYVVDAGTNKDYVMIIPTNLGACTVVLPLAGSISTNVTGRVLIVKDVGLASITNTITIYTRQSEQFEATLARMPVPPGGPISGINCGDQFQVITPFTSITLVAGSGGNWFVI